MRGPGSYAAEPANVTDRVRDVMVLTVPRLAIDELEPMVEPDPWMPDDGWAKRFTKDFIYDDVPRMAVSDEVYDLMRLAAPDVAELGTETVAEDPEIPDDGAGRAWAEALFVPRRAEEVAPYEVPEDACESFAALMATGCGFEEQPDWAEVGSMVCPSGAVWDVPSEPEGAFDLPEDCAFLDDYMSMGVLSVPEPASAPVEESVRMIQAPAGAPMIAAPAATVQLPAASATVPAIGAPEDVALAIEAPATEVLAIEAPVAVVPQVSAPEDVAAEPEVPEVETPEVAISEIPEAVAEAAAEVEIPVVETPETPEIEEVAAPDVPEVVVSAVPETVAAIEDLFASAETVQEAAVDAKVPLVMFTFGPQRASEGGRRVVFTF